MEGYWTTKESKIREDESRGYADGYSQKPLIPDASEAFIRGWHRAVAIVGEPEIPVISLSEPEELKKPVKVSLF